MATREENAAALRVVSFNIEYGIRVDSAIAVLTNDPALRNADVILLQEMDEKGTRWVADTLGMWYVYYPAVYRFNTHRDLGNAILARWPIVEDRKILLPHLSRFVHSQRVATAATIRVGEALVRVYSLHLGTMAGLAPAARRDQLEVVLADAEQYPRVVIGGDLNDPGIGQSRRTRATAGRPSAALRPRESEGWTTSCSRGSPLATAQLRAPYSIIAVPVTTDRFGP